MEIVQRTSTHNTTRINRSGIKYICIHYTAGIRSIAGSAINTALYFAGTPVEASADFIVDDTAAVQYNPDPYKYYCWAVGDSFNYTKGGKYYKKCTNANSISIEICSSNTARKITSPNDSYFYFTDAAVNMAVQLTKYLMRKYNVPADRVIRHYDVSGKLCPGIRGWNDDSGSSAKWEDFKRRISSDSSVTATTTTSTINNSNANSAKLVAAKKKSESYRGRYIVNATDGLNMRVGPGTNYSIITTYNNGSKVACYGYYGVSDGVTWLLVQGNGYTGYMSSEYLVKV